MIDWLVLIVGVGLFTVILHSLLAAGRAQAPRYAARGGHLRMVGETMTRQLIAEGWDSYRRAVIGEGVSPLMRRRLRAIFYAGATHLLAVLAELEGSEAYVEQCYAIQRELLAYIAEERAQSEKVQ